ncbi:glycoside hydrolase family 97 protein [Gaoshiqia sediminis]|uniref:Glycoside hydrolase family 97 protein n=1 Tax=Gaoshiqia sediminis TaxID=2986998 RepID=A0AA41YBR5_9BACT|nr:glycoside hydrolase family 97 protein [Gaoshiqia sediminis]MCW0484888.1 glycoside hydrolase family 97 protein [Gaoshiqia sediminis]
MEKQIKFRNPVIQINKKSLMTALFLVLTLATFSQQATVQSPNNKVSVALLCQQNREIGNWFLQVYYCGEGKTSEVISRIDLGISREDQDFSKELKFLKVGKPLFINEQYIMPHGKRSECKNSANELVICFENPSKAKFNLIIRAYNDGVAFRYEFPEKEGKFMVKEELTAYSITDSTKRWLQKYDYGGESLYDSMNDAGIQQNWGYPALFNSNNNSCWYLIHESDIHRSYSATKLSNIDKASSYKVEFPDAIEGAGSVLPTISLPWKSPWRVIILGSLADIVESTLVDDVSTPSTLTNSDWIKPGVASWNYWSHNHGTKDFKVVCEFADLAAEMEWPYTLLDWEWDQMGNGGNLEDALKYIHSIGVKPLMWYNSGASKWVPNTPRDRMLTHKSRVEEFAKLEKLGVAGVKVDFFLSGTQDMIKFYLDILEDAAQYNIMVNFHGCIVPRGWQRTYPHLMSYEAVRGAEWYNNGPEFTTSAPIHNNTLPYTRNVVGSMDYTPVTFTNSQYPHITSYGHELALSVVFESGIRHMADRPEGFYELPDEPKTFLKEVPSAWDDTKLLDGYPGSFTVIARRKGTDWYIGGINAETREKNKKLTFGFLPEGTKYKLTLIADGKHDKEFSIRHLVVDKNSEIEVKMLRRGGFAASLKPIN